MPLNISLMKQVISLLVNYPLTLTLAKLYETGEIDLRTI